MQAIRATTDHKNSIAIKPIQQYQTPIEQIDKSKQPKV
jgi:hypothetical protein